MAVSVLYWFHLNLHYATYFASRFCCNPILLQNCRWLVMVGRGGLGAEGRACNSSYVVPGRGRWGSPVSLSQTVASAAASSPASSCTCAEALQSLRGRAGSSAQQLSWNTILASVSRRECSCYVRNSATVQLPRAGIPALQCCLAQLHLLLIIEWCVELIVL